MERIKKWLSNDEAMIYLGVNRNFLKRLREKGQIPYSKVGRKVFYAKVDVDKMIKSHYIVRAV